MFLKKSTRESLFDSEHKKHRKGEKQMGVFLFSQNANEEKKGKKFPVKLFLSFLKYEKKSLWCGKDLDAKACEMFFDDCLSGKVLDFYFSFLTTLNPL